MSDGIKAKIRVAARVVGPCGDMPHKWGADIVRELIRAGGVAVRTARAGRGVEITVMRGNAELTVWGVSLATAARRLVEAV